MAPGFLRKIFDNVKGIISGDSSDGPKTSLLDKISNGVEAVSKIAEKSEPMIENVQKIIKKTRPKPKPKPKVEIVEEYEEEEPEPLPTPQPKRRRIAPVPKIQQRTFTAYEPDRDNEPYAPVGGSSSERSYGTQPQTPFRLEASGRSVEPDRDNEPYSISKHRNLVEDLSFRTKILDRFLNHVKFLNIRGTNLLKKPLIRQNLFPKTIITEIN
jgi:hypothetical protein